MFNTVLGFMSGMLAGGVAYLAIDRLRTWREHSPAPLLDLVAPAEIKSFPIKDADGQIFAEAVSVEQFCPRHPSVVPLTTSVTYAPYEPIRAGAWTKGNEPEKAFPESVLIADIENTDAKDETYLAAQQAANSGAPFVYEDRSWLVTEATIRNGKRVTVHGVPYCKEAAEKGERLKRERHLSAALMQA